jgi:hypothetical protein
MKMNVIEISIKTQLRRPKLEMDGYSDEDEEGHENDDHGDELAHTMTYISSK